MHLQLALQLIAYLRKLLRWVLLIQGYTPLKMSLNQVLFWERNHILTQIKSQRDILQQRVEVSSPSYRQMHTGGLNNIFTVIQQACDRSVSIAMFRHVCYSLSTPLLHYRIIFERNYVSREGKSEKSLLPGKK